MHDKGGFFDGILVGLLIAAVAVVLGVAITIEFNL
jgi:tetrahydromethanopterin S-methyltransferase subunit G